jgi:hypothetical protein
VEALIKKQGIHEGNWKLLVEIGFSATNVNGAPEGEPVLMPAAINLIQGIGILRTEEISNLSVDAAKVNPAPRSSKKGSSKKAKR